MTKICLCLFCLTLIIGCSASSISTRSPESSVYAPANQDRPDGEVSYLNAGVKSVREARRSDAYKKMHAHCGGAYEITKEEEQSGPWGPQRVIWFRCVEDDAAQSSSGSSR